VSAAFSIAEARSEADWAELVRLCWAYRDFLLHTPEPNPRAVLKDYPVDVYETLMADLPRLHTPPSGKAMLVWRGAQAVGCGMYCDFGGGAAEVKRVFLSEDARGLGAGGALMLALMDDIRAAGYRRIYLDTGSVLTGAIAMYESLGFVQRGPYQPVPEDILHMLRFFELEL
jgi:GNAT superfamily N-acetyltransferase